MNLSIKDMRFIIKALEVQLKIHNMNILSAEIEENEDLVSDLGNDIQFLELLLQNLKTYLEQAISMGVN